MPTPRQLRTTPRATKAVVRTAETSTPLAARSTSRRHRRGRPTLLDERTTEVLLIAIRAGNRLPAAACFAGISPKTFNEWMRRGRGVDGRSPVEPYVGLVRAVEHAQAEAEVAAVLAIRRAMSHDWRAAAWYLENVSEDWRRRKQAPEPGVTIGSSAPLAQKTILIDGATLRRLSGEQIRAERGEADLDEATLARRARLVTSDP